MTQTTEWMSFPTCKSLSRASTVSAATSTKSSQASTTSTSMSSTSLKFLGTRITSSIGYRTTGESLVAITIKIRRRTSWLRVACSPVRHFKMRPILIGKNLTKSPLLSTVRSHIRLRLAVKSEAGSRMTEEVAIARKRPLPIKKVTVGRLGTRLFIFSSTSRRRPMKLSRRNWIASSSLQILPNRRLLSPITGKIQSLKTR